MPQNVNRQWLLKTRPRGPIEADTFELRQSEVPVIGPGEFLVRNLWLSFDPAQRGWLNDLKSYVPPVAIGEPMRPAPSVRSSHRTRPISPLGSWCWAHSAGRIMPPAKARASSR